jgi:transcriptional regulator with XRE-family HTH domain
MNNSAKSVARDATAQIVAANLAAELTRQRWSARKAATALGLTNVYVSRRTSGDVELSASDLALFAGLLSIPISRFFEGLNTTSPASEETGLSIVGNKKATRGGALGGLSLPELDSNQQPAG